MKKGIISTLSALIGVVIGASAVGKVTAGETERAKIMSDKHLALFLMMNQWVKVKQEGKTLSEYFMKNSYKKIAVYGMSYAGETLIEELKGSEITVAYGIDQKEKFFHAGVEIVSAEDTLEDVDAVVVTAITFFDEIVEKLSGKLDCPIISLEDILYEV